MFELDDDSSSLNADTRRTVAHAWAFRWEMGRELAVRYARLAIRLSRLDTPNNIIELAIEAAKTEEQHAEKCAKVAARYGKQVNPRMRVVAPEIAPGDLSQRQQLLYEVVATQCVTQTVTTSMLAVLLRSAKVPLVKDTLRDLLQDEVNHNRFGWAHLGHQRDKSDFGFLGPLIPYMLAGAESADVSLTGRRGLEDLCLLEHGVLPLSVKRHVFENSLTKVAFPGLEAVGVDTGPAKRWLSVRRDIYDVMQTSRERAFPFQGVRVS